MGTNYIIRESIKFKLSKRQLDAINHANSCLTIDLFRDKTEAELMKALLLQIHFKVQKLFIKNQREVTLNLSVAEAIAFFALHSAFIAQYDSYTLAVVNQIITEIESKIL